MGGGGAKKGADASQKQLAQFLKDYQEQSDPTRQALFGQVLEAMRTGGVGDQLPFVTQAVEQSRAATSRSLAGFDARAAQTGMAGGSFAERIRAQLAQQGAQQAAGIPTDFAQFLISQAPGLATGSAGQIVGGLGQNAAVAAQREQAQMEMWSSLFKAGGNVGAAAAA